MLTGTHHSLFGALGLGQALTGNNLLKIRPCAVLQMDHDTLKFAVLMAADVMIK